MKQGLSALLAVWRSKVMWPMVFFAVQETGEQQFLTGEQQFLLSDKPDIFQKLKKNQIKNICDQVFNKRQ